jgi:hypothetical protein
MPNDKGLSNEECWKLTALSHCELTAKKLEQTSLGLNRRQLLSLGCKNTGAKKKKKKQQLQNEFASLKSRWWCQELQKEGMIAGIRCFPTHFQAVFTIFSILRFVFQIFFS